MFLVSFFFGILIGSVTFLTAILYGVSLPIAFASYAVTGAISVLTTVTFALAVSHASPKAKAERADATFVIEPKSFMSALPLPKFAGSRDRKPLRKMRILLVDDDDISLEILTEMLLSMGYAHITRCSSAFEAERILTKVKAPFDCLFLDIQMPQKDGIDLAREIRELPEYAETPIIMVTAMTDRRNISHAFAAGADDYVTKPFTVEDLKSRVKAAEIAFQQAVRVSQVHTLDPVQLAFGRWDIDLPQPARTIGSVITQSAMENYLRQIERGGLFSTNFFAVKLVNYDATSSQITPEEIRIVLAEVASATLLGLNDRNAFVAYCGSGTFACIVNGQDAIELTRLKTIVQEKLRAKLRPIDALPELTIKVSNQVNYVVTVTEEDILWRLYATVSEVKYEDADRVIEGTNLSEESGNAQVSNPTNKEVG